MITSFLLLQATKIFLTSFHLLSALGLIIGHLILDIRYLPPSPCCVVVLLICVVGARPRGELSLTNISIMSQCPVSSIQCPPPSLHRGHHV